MARPSVSSLREARRAVERLIRTGGRDKYSRAGLADMLSRALGAVGGTLGKMLRRALDPNKMTARELTAGVQSVVGELGGAAFVEPPPVIRGVPRPPPIPPGWGDPPTAPPPGSAPPPQPGAGSSSSRTKRTPFGAPPLAGETDGWHHTPQSSNVWGFRWDAAGEQGRARAVGTLFVAFKAPVLHDGVTRQKGTMNLSGNRGKTIAGKSNAKGPVYEYPGVTLAMYQSFLKVQHAPSKAGEENTGGADNSPGRWVWVHLRGRSAEAVKGGTATVYGGRRNNLKQGALVQTADGGMGLYVPRKSTKRGYVARASAALGTGRRAFSRNTIETQVGFSTRRAKG